MDNVKEYTDRTENPDIMVDLETGSNSPGGAILSIAAVTFDREKRGSFGAGFQQNVKFQDCIDRGMAVDASTIDWWMSKPPEVWESIRQDALPLPTALVQLNKFIGGYTAEDRRAWAKGSDFDFGMMLRPAYDLADVNPFWNFPPREFRCLRTLEVENSVKPEVPHDPLSDAKAQATDVIKYYTT